MYRADKKYLFILGLIGIWSIINSVPSFSETIRTKYILAYVGAVLVYFLILMYVESLATSLKRNYIIYTSLVATVLSMMIPLFSIIPHLIVVGMLIGYYRNIYKDYRNSGYDYNFHNYEDSGYYDDEGNFIYYNEEDYADYNDYDDYDEHDYDDEDDSMSGADLLRGRGSNTRNNRTNNRNNGNSGGGIRMG